MKVFFIILLRMLKTHKYNKAKFYYWWRFRWWRDVWWRDDQIPSRSTAFSCCEMCQILHASPYHYFPSSIMCLLLRFIMVITTKSPRIFCASKKCFCEHPAIHVICFYTKDVFRFQAIARLQELCHARKSLTSATGYDINPKVSLS